MLRIFLLVVLATTEVMSLQTGHQRHQDSGPTSWPARHPATRTKVSPRFFFHILKQKFKYPVVEKIPTAEPPANCICVPYYQCNSNNTIITDGTGIIDVRVLVVTFRRCTGDLEVCCRLPSPSMAPIVTPTDPPTTTTTTTTTTPAPTTTTTTTTTTTPAPTTTTTTTTTMAPTTTTTTTMAPTTTTTTTMAPTTTTTTTMAPTTTTTTTMAPTTTTTTMAPTPAPPAALCICVPIEQCDAAGFIIVAGEGIINPRQTQNPCPIAGQICCRLASATPAPTTPPPPPPAPPTIIVVQPFTCVCVQMYQCDPNGYVVISGAGVIDPRFPIGRQGQVAGTCVSLNQVCCRMSANPQPTSIGFPAADASTQTSGAIRNPGTAQACICVKSWQCTEGNAVSLDGAGIIDPRFGACPNADEICCRLQGITRVLVASSAAAASAASSTLVDGGTGNAVVVSANAASASQGSAASAVCGIRATTCVSPQACASKPGETSFAEFPWMVALLIRKPDGASLLFQCGASIINARSILTAAHCVIDRPSGVLVARFGEWNTANNDEPEPYQEVDVQTVVTHPLYYNGGLYNDVAVLVLSKPITYSVNVRPICLPQQGMAFAPGTSCWATGWGRSAFQGQYQTILRKVDLPIVDRADCQTRLRATRLGQYFQLHGSFICAGGESSKDTCRGDGGGPLVCPTASGQFVQAGIVSWGIGCGESNTPAVYASVSQFRQWIDQQLANYGVL